MSDDTDNEPTLENTRPGQMILTTNQLSKTHVHVRLHWQRTNSRKTTFMLDDTDNETTLKKHAHALDDTDNEPSVEKTRLLKKTACMLDDTDNEPTLEKPRQG